MKAMVLGLAMVALGTASLAETQINTINFDIQEPKGGVQENTSKTGSNLMLLLIQAATAARGK